MIKLLLELHISRAAPVEDEAAGKERVTINIRDLTLKAPEVKVQQVIEGEYTDEEKQ